MMTYMKIVLVALLVTLFLLPILIVITGIIYNPAIFFCFIPLAILYPIIIYGVKESELLW